MSIEMLLKKQFTPSEKYEIYEAQKLVIYIFITSNPGQNLCEDLLKMKRGSKE
jgi:hypothetical protein